MITGKDVNARKKTSQGESISLNQAFNHFLEKRDLKDKTILDYRRVIDTTLKSWNRKRIIDITRNMVEKKHSQIKKDAEENYIQRYKNRNYKPTKEEITKRGGGERNKKRNRIQKVKPGRSKSSFIYIYSLRKFVWTLRSTYKRG